MSWYGSWWLVWRVWKWLFRFFTGKCELQRLCLASGSAALRILRIGGRGSVVLKSHVESLFLLLLLLLLLPLLLLLLLPLLLLLLLP